MSRWYLLLISCLLLIPLIGYGISNYSIKRQKSLNFNKQNRWHPNRWTIFFTICGILGILWLEFSLIKNSAILFNQKFLLFFSALCIAGIWNGLIILFPIIHSIIKNGEKDRAMGFISSSVGIGIMVLYGLFNIIFMRYVAILALLFGFIFMLKSLKRQIRSL